MPAWQLSCLKDSNAAVRAHASAHSRMHGAATPLSLRHRPSRLRSLASKGNDSYRRHPDNTSSYFSLNSFAFRGDTAQAPPAPPPPGLLRNTPVDLGYQQPGTSQLNSSSSSHITGPSSDAQDLQHSNLTRSHVTFTIPVQVEDVNAEGSSRSHQEALPKREDTGFTVAEALARAQDAISRAESSLESIEELPSARPPSQLSHLLRLFKQGVIISTLCLSLVGSQALGLGAQWLAATVAAVGIAWWGYRKSALSPTGALAALVVGAGTIGCSLRFGVTLLAFFFSSSKLTAFKEELKDKLDDSHVAKGHRDWKQVLCNGGLPMVLAVAYGILVGCVDVPLGLTAHVEPWRAKFATLLGGAFLGYYACCCGDTWASELGPLSSDTPRLITTLRPVRRGTNGGVTLLGLSASILGGVFVGAVFYAAAIISPTLWILDGLQAAAIAQWRLIPLGLMAGLFGSVLDSLLGATLQYSGFNRSTGRVTNKPGADVTHISGISFLDNNMVNLVSATITAALTAVVARHMFAV